MRSLVLPIALGLSSGCGSLAAQPGGADDELSPSVRGWLHWRGPHQNGVSDETGLVDTLEVGGEQHLWTYEVASRGTPVIAGGRVFGLAYAGEGPDLREQLFCLDAATGEERWVLHFTDFLNDSVYSRYAIGSPTVDAETGNIYSQTSAGLLHCHTPEGEMLWEISLMEELGRLTFPNGRIGAPVIEGDHLLIHAIISSWGSQGPARDRYYAIDKRTGEVIWGCTPGLAPKDSSFAAPVLEWRNGRRLLYGATGCGNVVCIDARSGQPLWRFDLSKGGINSTPVIHGDTLIEIHGKENHDTSEVGRMVSLRLGTEPEAGATAPVVLGAESELWRNNLYIFTSSPVLVGDRVYQTVHTGELCCVDANDGTVLWKEKLAAEQVHASPVWADGKLYVPMHDGTFHIVRPTDDGPEFLSEVQLEGECLGAPAISDGRIFVHTTEKLYCFGKPRAAPAPSVAAVPLPVAGEAAQLQVVPADLHLRAGESARFVARTLDAKGNTVAEDVAGLEWDLPEHLGLDASADGSELRVFPTTGFGAAEITVRGAGVTGKVRLRVVPSIPHDENFDAIPLTVPHYAEEGVKMAFPPSHWFSSKPKWEVRDLDGERVLAKRLDNMLFQRSMVLISDPDHAEYTTQVDIYTDGTRRMLSTGGLVNQRYLISLKGNAQEIEISSNYERIEEAVPFKWKAKQWYTLKASCVNHEDGSTTVRAKAWLRDESEPEGWNIEYRHRYGNRVGAYGVFGYAPQARFRVYLDNFTVTPNAP